MHARGPPPNVMRWPHTPGRLEIAAGGSCQRSGLECLISTFRQRNGCRGAYLNSYASSPHIAFERCNVRIGMIIGQPAETLQDGWR